MVPAEVARSPPPVDICKYLQMSTGGGLRATSAGTIGATCYFGWLALPATSAGITEAG